MIRTAIFVWLSLLAFMASKVAAADCPCGYQDPTTGALWTDAILTYFNETDASDDIVTAPASSPYIEGQKGAGDTGSGTQDWSNVGGQTNSWEDAFSATYRSAVLYNNTEINNSQLEMTVQPAQRSDRIVYGAEFVTRRRDILYGSFRASMNSSYEAQSGTGFRMSAKYNESETIDLGLFMSDLRNESTLQWSYSASGTDADPVEVPIASLLGASSDGFLEHRFDWQSDSILYSNNNTNLSASTQLVTKDDSHTMPSMPVPLSFRHWSNGDTTASEGPPLYHAQVASVRYVRFFFNSSMSSREAEFNSQCDASTSAVVCSTDDETLRGSTAFDQDAILAVSPYKVHRDAPLYSLIGMTVSGGLLIILVIHSIVKNLVKGSVAKHRPVPAEEELDEMSLPVNVAPEVPFHSHSPTSSNDGLKGGDVEKDLTSSSSNSHNRGSIVSQKWDAAVLTRDQLQDDSDESDTEGVEDDEDDYSDNDLMVDANEEMEITNDDGLGRPDHVQLLSHYPSSSSSDLPQHLQTQRESNQHVSSPMPMNRMNGYITPSRSSHPSVQLSQSESDDAGWHNNPTSLHPPSTWSRYGSAAPFRLAQNNNDFAELHKSLLASEDGDEGSFLRASLYKGEGDSPPSSSSTHFESRRNSLSDPWLKNRRPSLASLSSFATLNAALPFSNMGQSTAPPVISVWTPLQKNKEEGRGKDQGEMLAARVNVTDTQDAAASKASPWWKRAFEYMFVNEGGSTLTASGAARVSYLEGLRGFACFLVSFNHFMLMFWYAATTAGAPTHTNGFELWFYRIVSPLVLNQGTKIGIFFVLPARVMGTRYMLRGKLQDVADSTLRRVPRLAFPTFGAVLINYFLIQVDGYKWVPRLASRTWSTWAYYQDYDSAGSFINAWIGLWFTLPPEDPVLLTTYATGVLWTIPVITQSSFAILITVIISKEIPNAYKRYGFYFFCILLSWYANRFDYYFISGLVIADMDNKLHYREAAARGFPIVPRSFGQRLPKFFNEGRVHGQVFGWILFFGGSLVQYLEFLGLPGGRFNLWEHGILPDLNTAQPLVLEGTVSETYNDPRISLFVMVIGIFLLCDLCQSFSNFFMLRWWGAIGRNAFSLYLLHGIIFWTWGAWSCLQLLDAGAPYWAAITVVFVTSYFLLAIFCELFTRTFDAWGVSLSKALWRYSSAGLGRRD